MTSSEAKIFADNDDIKIGKRRFFSDDSGNVADPCGTLAVHADTGLRAGVGLFDSLIIDRGGVQLNPLFCCGNIADNLIDPGNNDDFLGPENHGSHPVSDAVDIDQLAVKSDRIAA